MTGSVNGRRLKNWISSFIHLTENTEAPLLFRKWAGISVLGAMLERRVWSQSNRGVLYPNLYVILVGPPGAGKSIILSLTERILRKVNNAHVAPSSVTSASLVDTVVLANCTVLEPDFMQYNSLQVISSELQNFIPAYEAPFMGLLTKLYDCELYEERRRTGKVQHIKIENPQLSILAGTTPSYLNTLLPEGAWDQGFTSRTIFIFSEKPAEIGSIFATDDVDLQYRRELEEDLAEDMKLMKEVKWMKGKIQWNSAAKDALQRWIEGGMQPKPEHGRLAHYNSRRLQHTMKLSLIAAISRDSFLKEVMTEDFEQGLGWLLEAESFMPSIFQQMSTTPESRSMEDATYHIKQLEEKLKMPVPEYYLISFLRHRAKPNEIQKMIDVMVRSKMIKQVFNSNGTCYSFHN